MFNIKRSFSNSILFLSAFLVSSTSAFAGYTEVPVPTNVTNILISGSLGVTRNSADNFERIYINDFGNSMEVRGREQGLAGDTASCMTNNATHISQLRAVSSTVRISVFHNGAGTCTDVRIQKGSPVTPPV